MAGKESSASTDAVSESKGFWEKLEDFFFPDEDRAVYSEGLRRGGYLVTVTGVSPATYDKALDILDDEGSIDLEERAESWRSQGWDQKNVYGASGAVASGTTATTASTVADGREEVIPVVEEELRVGKRDLNHGRVRVRSYVVENPVSEQVSLRDENVSIERRTVDRPLTATENAFVDRTIEAEEHHEEAVVSKDARVVEEISLRKTADQREETIRDTVRRTEVEVEDDRSTGAIRKE
ncbi:YsnF/AvaK domain-containing protein [Agrobacterium vitis]|uniref:YsnF/AvaK domain-containing protein n=1 Tax=Agrobacterium vitis TaxID=373 RepID=UPI000AA2B494